MGAVRPENRERTVSDRTRPAEDVVSRFAATAASFGEAMAAVDGAASLTYDELDRRSNQLARFLLRHGARPGSLVGLHAGRSVASLIAIVATLKIRAGYVPLDPASPGAYLDFILNDCRAELVLSGGRDADLFYVPTLNLHDALSASLDEAELAPEQHPGPEDIAYVMYTSGTTGRPKGVVIPHRAVIRLVTNQSFVRLGPDEVMLHNSPLSFDASTFEIWGTLLHGARGVLIADDHPSLKSIANTIEREGVTTAWFTAGLFRALVDQELDALSGLRQLLAGGDVLSPSHVMRALAALPDCQLINGYGPTENTTFTTCYRIPAAGWGGGPVPIGVPINGTYVRLLDDEMKPVRDGETGMLYAGGLGLALGYSGAASRSAEQFVIDSQIPGARLYRTGDLVRRRPDGNLDFLGRHDRQVKIDGKRVELGEIEEMLRRCPGVNDAVVTAARGDPGLLVLTAYIKPAATDHGTSIVAAVHRQALQALPPHMRPSRVVMLHEFPVTANGKIDYERLSFSAPSAPSGKVAATSETERVLSEIFSDVLGGRGIAVETNFFELGATSLKLVEAHASISKRWPEVEVLALFRHPNIRDLARSIDGGHRSLASTAHRQAGSQVAALRLLYNARRRR